MKLHTGSHGQYEWLTSEDHELADLMRCCPETVLGKHIVVISIDSGSLELIEEQKAVGGKHARISPIVLVSKRLQNYLTKIVMVGA